MSKASESDKRQFSPTFEFLELVGMACIEILKKKRQKHAVINKYRNQLSKRVHGKFFKFVISITRNFNKLNYLFKRISKSRSDKLDPEKIEFYIAISLIFYFKEKSILGEALLRDRDHSIAYNEIKKLEVHYPVPGWSWYKFMEAIKDSSSIQEFLSGKDDITRLSIYYSHPTFFIKKMLEFLDGGRLKAILIEHEADRNFFITCAGSKENSVLQSLLQENGMTFRLDKYIINLFHVENVPGWKKKIKNSKEFKRNKILFQDFGSAVVIEALDVRKGDVILDCCAAPFQKSVALSWRCGPAGYVVAIDFHSRRVFENYKRAALKRSGNIFIINGDIIKVYNTLKSFKPNKILLDVPCTGSGSIKTYPELKWRQSEKQLMRCVEIQKQIMESVLRACKENEWFDSEIVYSTCSYYKEEGEEIIDSFLDRIELLDLHDAFTHGKRVFHLSRGWPGYKCSDKVLRTFPDLHFGCKGFFVSKFRIK
ncbi:MAG: hypothetical protein ACTSWN_04945 [Promethearchaeota archaeon]